MQSIMSRNELLQYALIGFEYQKGKLDGMIQGVREQLAADEPKAVDSEAVVLETPLAPKKRKRRMSAAGRKAIAEAQRRRWASKQPTRKGPVSIAAKKGKVA